ncbi:MAG: hypothetical protein AB1405_13530 [Bdellovibrionota bacterium]
MGPHISEERLQAIAFGDTPALAGEKNHFVSCESCRRALKEYEEAAGLTGALAKAPSHPLLRPGFSGRVLARAREEKAGGNWIEKLLKVARFEIPALAAVAAALLLLGIRTERAGESPQLAAAAQAEEEMVFWPAEETDEAWAEWLFTSEESDTDG